MTFANVGKLGVKPGSRDEVVAILTRANADLTRAGCLLYEVGTSDDDPHTVFVSEVWESQEAHQASLKLDSVRAAIAEAMPLLSGEMSGNRFEIAGSPIRTSELSTDPSHTHNSVDYIEITVTNLAASKKFYAETFGWSFTDYGPSYAGITNSAGAEIGGLHAAGEISGTSSPLVIMFSNDIKTSVEAVTRAGGNILQEPYDFPGGRRFHFSDPDGTELAVWSH